MRVLFCKPASFLCFFLSLTVCSTAKINLEVRKKAFFSTESFQRIPEFFTGKEYEGLKVYCRSNDASRDGFYFVVKISGSLEKEPSQMLWDLDWLMPHAPRPRTKQIPIENPNIFGKEVFVGLTGGDWPRQSVQPLAWCLKLLDGEGREIAQKKSFLWSK